MKVIIDARSRMSFEKVYSIPLFERILRQLNELKADVEAIILLPPDCNPDHALTGGFSKRYKIRKKFITTVDPLQKVISAESAGDGDMILLEGDGIYDERIISALISSPKSILICDGSSPLPLAARLSHDHIGILLSSQRGVMESINNLVESGSVHRFEIRSMNNYVRFLRRNVIPLITRIVSKDQIPEIENTMYANTFKGTLELVAVYGYRIPVRELTKLFARTPITPNHVTAAALICSFGAIPFLALGWLWTGILMAAGFIIFDSLDGKLARMTIRLSKAADRFDHLTSTPTRSAWYLAMGWHLSNGNLLDGTGLFALVYAAMPYVDKLTGVAFNARFGRSPLDYTPLDAKVHLFTVRRNDIFLMILGLSFGFIETAYRIAAIWALLTWLWHLYRFIWFNLFPLKKEAQS